jgi:hypothetical protein
MPREYQKVVCCKPVTVHESNRPNEFQNIQIYQQTIMSVFFPSILKAYN